MAVYRFSAQVIGRSNGRSATAAAAYRSGILITDERTGLTHDYRRRGGVVHAEILRPEGAPDFTGNRADLWNAVEQVERRKDAQLAREILTSLPHELDEDQRRDLVREFIEQEFVSRGMIADYAIHAPDREGDNRNHHAHIMLTMRDLTEDGFGKKNRSWNDTGLLESWREKWADYQNRHLEHAGFDIRVDHRSLEARGIDREPEPKLGAVATEMERDGRPSKAGDDIRAIWLRNAEREMAASESEILDYEIAAAKLNQSQSALDELEHRETQAGAFDHVFAAQQAVVAEECTHQQEIVDDYAAKLEGRGRVAIFWDKLRGRLGWRAEQEYEAAQMALKEAQQQQEALDRALADQKAREHEAARMKAAKLRRELAEMEHEKIQARFAQAAAEAERADKAAQQLRQQMHTPEGQEEIKKMPTPEEEEQAARERNAELFRQRIAQATAKDKEKDLDPDID